MSSLAASLRDITRSAQFMVARQNVEDEVQRATRIELSATALSSEVIAGIQTFLQREAERGQTFSDTALKWHNCTGGSYYIMVLGERRYFMPHNEKVLDIIEARQAFDRAIQKVGDFATEIGLKIELEPATSLSGERLEWAQRCIYPQSDPPELKIKW